MISFLLGIFNPGLIWEMVQNVLGFLFWLLNFAANTLYTCLVVLPLRLVKFLFNFALALLSPVFATCTDSGCTLNDIGRAMLVVLVLLGVVGLLKWQGTKQGIGK
ncbi:MAG: hypothetical protein AAB486_01155 [Patescibacteria group bacterium]